MRTTFQVLKCMTNRLILYPYHQYVKQKNVILHKFPNVLVNVGRIVYNR